MVNSESTKTTTTTERHSDFLKSLVEFTKDHRAARWTGTFSEFLEAYSPPIQAASRARATSTCGT